MRLGAKMSMSRKNKLDPRDRYSALLLFQFRFNRGRHSGRRRAVERRLILLRASSAAEALSQAKRRGRDDQFEYENADGKTVYFEFIGILDLVHLGIECEPDEGWYSIGE